MKTIINTNILSDVVREYYNVNQSLKGLKAKRDELNEGLKQAIPEYGSIEIDGYKVTKSVGSNNIISKSVLLELGVPEETINKATKTIQYDTIRVTKTKKK